MKELSEETAQQLLNVMNLSVKSNVNFNEVAESMINTMVDTTKAALMLSVAIWKVKLNTSYLFTRWYYKRKLNQAESKLKSFNQIKL